MGRDGTLSYRNQGWDTQTRTDGTSQATHQQSGARFGYDDQGRLQSAQMGNTRADFSYHPDDHQDPRLRGQVSDVRYTGPDGQARTMSNPDVRWDERNNMFSASGRDTDGTRRQLQMDLNRGQVGEGWDRNGNGGFRIRSSDGSQNLRDYTNTRPAADSTRNVTTDRELDRSGRETSRTETTTDRTYDNQRNLNRQVVTTETPRNGGRPNYDITGNIRQPNGQWSELRTVNGRQLYNTTPRADGRPDTANDGALIGRGGQVYEPSVPLNRAPAIGPNNGRRPTETVLFVNGINNSRQDVQESMQALANQGGYNVVGVFNASRGTAMDVAQSIGDKWGISGNPATATLRDQVLGELRAGRDVHLFAHSQGGIITSGALGEVKDRLTSQYGEQRANEMMNRIRVETFGGAAWRYPDGPQYIHRYHTGDPVSTSFGQGLPWWVSPAAAMARNPGANATTVRIPLSQQGISHNFTNTYVPYIRPFNEVYQRR
jgi:pimeloyl-ACP methyl ester carboxylesterase